MAAPNLHPQIVKVERSTVCQATPPMLLDRSAPAAAAYAMPRAAPHRILSGASGLPARGPVCAAGPVAAEAYATPQAAPRRSLFDASCLPGAGGRPSTTGAP